MASRDAIETAARADAQRFAFVRARVRVADAGFLIGALVIGVGAVAWREVAGVLSAEAAVLATLAASGVIAAILLLGRLTLAFWAGALASLLLLALAGSIAARAWGGLAHDAAAWAGVLIAALIVLVLSTVRPFRRVETRHGLLIAAPMRTIAETLLPDPRGGFWKRGLWARPVAGRPGVFDIDMRAEGRIVATARVLVTATLDPESGRGAVGIGFVDEGASDASLAGSVQSYGLQEIDGVTFVAARVRLRRPTLGFLLMHAVLDLPLQELRNLRSFLGVGPPGAFDC